MFKNATIHRLGAAWAPDLCATNEALAAATFTPCGPTQHISAGFVPPRNSNGLGDLVEAIDGQWMLKVKIETRTVPAQTLKKRVAELAATIEQQTGRKPGAKVRKELKEQALLELLPQAFTKEVEVFAWIDPAARLLVLDTASATRADAIVTMLVRTIEGLEVSYVHTEMSPSAAMTHWLGTGEAPQGFTVDRECELVAQDELRSVVRYGKHPLDVDNVREHIKSGKVATKVALTWRDRVSFVLTEAMQLRKVQFLDVVFEGKSQDDDQFDADVAILTGELGEMMPDLLEALGGVMVQEGGAA